jgi:hypothetical protein
MLSCVLGDDTVSRRILESWPCGCRVEHPSDPMRYADRLVICPEHARGPIATPKWRELATERGIASRFGVMSEERWDALAAELERVTAALRSIASMARTGSSVTERTIAETADDALAGAARAAQEDA